MTKLLRSVLGSLALSMALLGGSSLAFADNAQPAPAQAAKKQAPSATFDGKFDHWLVGPRGKIDGILMADGSIVRVHESSVRDTSLKSGDALHVDAKGGGTTFHRAKITKNGVVVVDDSAAPAKGQKGPHDKDANKTKLGDISANGTIVALLQGHKGKVVGVVLKDGTAAYAKHHQDLSSFGLKKGDTVTVNGKGGSYALGKGLVIESIKLPSGDTKTL